MPIKVFASNSVRGATEALIPLFERAGGQPVEAIFDPAAALQRRIDAGEPADVALLGKPTMDQLVAQGVISAATVRALASSGVGVGVKSGAPHPDIGTVDAFVAMLLAAESIAHTTEGASGMYFSGLIDTLGLGEQVRAKTRTRPGGLVGEVLVAGGAQIGIQQISELRAVPGVDVVGPLPEPIQKIFANAAGVFSRSSQPDAARTLIEFLTGPSAAPVYTQHGLTAA
ncbi:MAG: substrate-binding domain-containing protein [Proteobacteria bacterium]|nr:substrate-binding domain-containing protein [Burkholderiales bacterium]